MEEISLRNYAYIGDAVWELHIRNKTIFLTQNSKKLHDITTSKVKMNFQSELLNNLSSQLTDQEQDLARRARNLSIPIARRHNQNEYRQATAFEALIGFWYINDKERLKYITTILDRYIEL